jgi:hypothetical protein
MREMAVKADRHTEPDRDIRDRKNHEVMPVEVLVPRLPYSHEQEHYWRDSHDPSDRPMQADVR